MDTWFVVDGSFVVALVLLAFMTVALVLRRMLTRRRAQREQRRAARRSYRRWLRESGLQPLDPPERDNAKRR
ncbi:MAG TPA: hypothetical protein VMS38_27300 [Pseudorhodoferax sp.]|jgi:cytochrome c biogenesis protein ResB|nr:hypothetical protein [Pseudorhodoferax sp.]